jgi:hypothetical protein
MQHDQVELEGFPGAEELIAANENLAAARDEHERFREIPPRVTPRRPTRWRGPGLFPRLQGVEIKAEEALARRTFLRLFSTEDA